MLFLILILAALLPSTSPAAPADDSIDATLDALDQRGKTLQDFSARVKLTETDPALGISNIRIGKVWFQKKTDGDARFRVVFDRKIQSKNIAVPNKIEYLLHDGWLTDRDYQKKIEVNRQVAKQGEKINLLKLGEGPFPLPIGQSKEDVHGQFDVTQAPAASDDAANTVHLVLKPKAASSLAKRFTSLEVWVDPKNSMPVRIDTLDAGGGEQKRTDLTEIVVNKPGGLKDSNFTLPTINDDWSRRDEPFDKK
jgi:outer membrane lipoprotein-sorting protein